MHRRVMDGGVLTKFGVALVSVFLLLVGAVAEPVTGVVTNKTNGKPAANDDVVLLRLAQGMQELARAKTDNKGRFSIEVPADGLHLLRVTHDKANYFQPIQPGTQSVEIGVYSAAAVVRGVSLEADVMRLQTDASGGLRVVEHFFVKNESQPETTLMSEHPFELYLPHGAVVEGSAAKAPGGMAVQSPLVPETEADKFTLIFPIRPGSTEFQVTYKLPYANSLTFHPRPVMTTGTIVVMMPKSMTFKAGPSAPYASVAEDVGAQTYVAQNVQPSQPIDFTVSGTGELPRDTASGTTNAGTQTSTSGTADPQSPTDASQQMRADTKPGKGIGNPLDSDGTLEPFASKYKWWIIGGLVLLFAAGAGVMLRSPQNRSRTVALPEGDILQVLKNEMFALETDRLEGKLSESQYSELKQAMDTVLRRSLARKSLDHGGMAPVASE